VIGSGHLLTAVERHFDAPITIFLVKPVEGPSILVRSPAQFSTVDKGGTARQLVGLPCRGPKRHPRVCPSHLLEMRHTTDSPEVSRC
jgi:hypothetical protein